MNEEQILQTTPEQLKTIEKHIIRRHAIIAIQKNLPDVLRYLLNHDVVDKCDYISLLYTALESRSFGILDILVEYDVAIVQFNVYHYYSFFYKKRSLAASTWDAGIEYITTIRDSIKTLVK